MNGDRFVKCVHLIITVLFAKMGRFMNDDRFVKGVRFVEGGRFMNVRVT